MDKDAVRQRVDIVNLIGQTVKLTKDGDHFRGLCPFHDDHSPSLIVYPETRRWQCFGCSKNGDCFQWVMHTTNVDFPTALAQLRGQCGDTAKITTWDITDVDGNLIAQHMRYDHPDGTKTYSWNGQDGLGGLKVADLPLYGIKHLFDRGSAGVEEIIMTEGEKAADAPIKAGYAAVATVTGASGCPNREAFVPLIGFQAKICLWPDNDDIGRSHMDKVACQLEALNVQPYLIKWPEAPPKGDAHDFVQRGGDIQRLVEAAVPWESPTPPIGNVTIYGYREQTLQPESPNNRYKNVTDSCCNGSPSDAATVRADEPIFERVLRWVKETSGWWSTQELDTDLGFKDTKSKDYRRLIVHRLKQQGIIEPHPRVNKSFRYVDKHLTRLDFKRASGAGVLPLKWPFGIERYVNLYPGNLVVVAGSQNAGKTALLLNVIRLNMDQFPIVDFLSEMRDVELRQRLEMFPDMSIDDWRFDAYPRSRDFQDVVKPDIVNIIDFLEISDEFWKVNAMLTAITEKIGTGVAIVALQKKPGALLGRGDSFSLERPRLYLSMDKGTLTIVKGKSWANPKVDPNGLTIGFKISGGCQFKVSKTWHLPEADPY